MSTENEGYAVPAAPTAPPAPAAPPAPGAAPAPAAQQSAPSPSPASADWPPPVAPPAGEQAPVASTAGERAPGSPFPPAAPENSSHHPHERPAAAHEQPASTPPPPASSASGGWPPPPPAFPGHGGGGSGDHAWGDPAPGPAGPSGPGSAPGGRRTGGLVAAVLAAALLAGGIGGGVGYWAADRGDDAESTTVSSGTSPGDVKRADGTVAAVAAKALPSVVTIEAKGDEGDGGTGTGFVYDQQGHILTNNHVVASAADGGELTATFSDGKEYDAEVVGRAEGYDVAVLQLKNASGLTPLPLGDSDKVAVGDSTIAIGAPFGLSNTVTTGIISAKNRPVASGDGTGSSNSYMSALQTDASINPGNSGGPLLDATGAVIGINSAIQSTSSPGASQSGSIGLGFAIPVNQAKNVAEQLIKTGEPVYPVIGVSVAMEEDSDGATISEEGQGGSEPVTPDGPADKAGLRPGDVITKLNDTSIDSGPTLISEIWTYKPGDKVKITYERDGKESTVELTLGQREGDD